MDEKSVPLLQADESPRPRTATGPGALLVLYSVILLVTSVFNAIGFKRLTTAMPNYTWFLSFTGCLLYAPIFGTIAFATALSGNLDRSNLKFPKYKFAIMGCLDSLLSIMAMLGGAYTTGATQVVLAQAAIPVTLVATAVALGTEYHPLQYVGAGVMIVGVAAAKVPSLIWPMAGDVGKDIFNFNLIFLATCLPNAIGTVYKEMVFRDVDIDVNYMQAWVAFFQFFLGFLLAPIQNLPFLGPHRVAFRDMLLTLVNGSKCLILGFNSVVENCGGAGQIECDNCPTAWMAYAYYTIFNILYNIFGLLVVKHGGATLSFLVATFRLPLTSFAFYSKSIVGSSASTPRISDFVGLAILLAGLVIYRIGGQRIQEDTQDVKHFHFFSSVMEPVPNVIHMHDVHQETAHRIRSNLYWRLAVASPLHSPALRDRTGSDAESPKPQWFENSPGRRWFQSSPALQSPDIPRRWRRASRRSPAPI